MRIHILVVDDEESYCEILKYNLEKEGYEVDTADSAETALGYDLSIYQLMIVDIMMERLSGFDFAKRVRNNPATENVPIIFCSALNGEDETVMGLNIGADDYITKPFSLMVLISKVNALMRRIGQDQDDRGQMLFSRDIRVQCREMRVYKGDEELILSKKEIQLLLYFLENPKQILSKEQLLEAVWDVDAQFVDDNTVPVTISRLKKRIAGDEDYEYIKNVRGLGYLWTAEVSGK